MWGRVARSRTVLGSDTAPSRLPGSPRAFPPLHSFVIKSDESGSLREAERVSPVTGQTRGLEQGQCCPGGTGHARLLWHKLDRAEWSACEAHTTPQTPVKPRGRRLCTHRAATRPPETDTRPGTQDCSRVHTDAHRLPQGHEAAPGHCPERRPPCAVDTAPPGCRQACELATGEQVSPELMLLSHAPKTLTGRSESSRSRCASDQVCLTLRQEFLYTGCTCTPHVPHHLIK